MSKNGQTADILCRPFQESDIDSLVEILELNNQYAYPDVEGPEAMRRVALCEAAVFVVAEVSGKPRGFVRGIYDGSRALIHLMSVHPNFQGSGIGKVLVKAATDDFKRRGAPTVSVTVTNESSAFWAGQGFKALPVFLMLKETGDSEGK